MKYATVVVVIAIVLSTDAVSSWERTPKSHGKGLSLSTSSSARGSGGKGKGGRSGSSGRLGGEKGGGGGSDGGEGGGSSHSRTCKTYDERCYIDRDCCSKGNGHHLDLKCVKEHEHDSVKVCAEVPTVPAPAPGPEPESAQPTAGPTSGLTSGPTSEPTTGPVTAGPTMFPTSGPTGIPTTAPTTEGPTSAPVDLCPAVTIDRDVDYANDCFTGSSADVTTQCVANDNTCCVDPANGNVTVCLGEPVCSWEGNATVCRGSCLGALACDNLGNGVELGGNNTIKIGPGSCIGSGAGFPTVGGSACQGLLGSVGAGSCRGDYPCSRATGPIGAGSCFGLDACSAVGGSVGDCSCLFEQSCPSRQSVGSGSCLVQNGTESASSCEGYAILDDITNCTSCEESDD